MSARKASDFSQFKDYLQQWVDVSLQKAAAIDPSRPAYDVSSCNPRAPALCTEPLVLVGRQPRHVPAV